MTDYLNGFHYENQTLKFFATAEGYVNTNISSGNHIRQAFSYVYNYTDHLGNICLSYTKGTRTNSPVILEENHYYPFGLKHKKYGSVDMDFVVIDEETEEGYYVGVDVVPPQARKTYQYKYNGKEFQDELNLNVYDYGARNYQPDLGRFFVIDLFSEQYSDRNPYHYVSNNPVNKVDVQGHFEISVKDQAQYKTLTKYLKNGIGEILNNPAIMSGLQQYGHFSEQQIRDKIVKFGKGSIKLEIKDNLPFNANGYYMGGSDNPIQLDKKLADQIENATSDEMRELAILSFLITALHESVHYGEFTYKGINAQKPFEFKGKWDHFESDAGNAFEVDAFWGGNYDLYEPHRGQKKGKEGMNAMKTLVKNKMTADKLSELTQGLQDIIKKIQEENPNVEIFIME